VYVVIKIDTGKIEKIVTDQLFFYSSKVREKVNRASKQVAAQAVRDVKAAAPEDTGVYKRGIIKKEKVSFGESSFIIGNRSRKGLLAHILEYGRSSEKKAAEHILSSGHALRGGGRTSTKHYAKPHFAPAEEKAVKNFTTIVERIIKNER
jgi:hypothetical protein